MGREYKHSVKGSLTRKLVLLIIITVVLLYVVVVFVEVKEAKN